MIMRKIVLIRYLPVLLILSGITITGCIDLKPRTDSTRYFVLGATGDSSASTSSTGAITVGIRSFSIAPYLDSPRIATRVEGVEITYSANSRWGEPLKQAIQKKMVAELGSSSAIGHVYGLPWPSNADPSRTLAISVDNFEGQSDGTVVAGISWTVFDAGGMILERGTALEEVPGWIPGEYRDLVLKLNQALSSATARIAASVESTG